MNKIQKLWLTIFLAIFIIPEILWSPLMNYIYSLTVPLMNGSVQVVRNNFLLQTQNINLYNSVVFIQFLGIFLAFIYWIVVGRKVQNKLMFWSIVLLFFILSLVTLIVFGLSVSLRHIAI
jgi:hypothetical protein